MGAVWTLHLPASPRLSCDGAVRGCPAVAFVCSLFKSILPWVAVLYFLVALSSLTVFCSVGLILCETGPWVVCHCQKSILVPTLATPPVEDG
ncbi:uncharacterized protein BDV14DRAFT_175865 [Aspergillus stella-maris]|uniref:uncharacterized protein n=1 Tax=Aspergillus stella-maris TaxID=1810926 RepID=UPI003CCCA4F7